MGYTNDPNRVRVDFFTKDGRFIRSESLIFPEIAELRSAVESELRTAFGRALRTYLNLPGRADLANSIAVCPAPPPPNDRHPVMLACSKLNNTVL